jgi:alpha-ketoglutarate-dependent taurine dioxygenase
MKYIEPIEFPGIDNVINNIEVYKKKFLEDSVILFRNANLNYDSQSLFHFKLSQLLNFHSAFDTETKLSNYIENHSKTPNVQSAKKDDVILNWHLEHVTYKNPIVISTWNMIKFTTDSENGKTYFIDFEKVYDQMPEDWKKFLNSCKVNHPGDKPWNSDEEFSVIYDHWITGKPVLRMVIREYFEDTNQLVSVDGKNPTDNDKELFKKISLWVGNYAYHNENSIIVQKWKEGDLLIVDIFKLAHAVTGGFDPNDREFIGIWGYKDSKYSK